MFLCVSIWHKHRIYNLCVPNHLQTPCSMLRIDVFKQHTERGLKTYYFIETGGNLNIR